MVKWSRVIAIYCNILFSSLLPCPRRPHQPNLKLKPARLPLRRRDQLTTIDLSDRLWLEGRETGGGVAV